MLPNSRSTDVWKQSGGAILSIHIEESSGMITDHYYKQLSWASGSRIRLINSCVMSMCHEKLSRADRRKEITASLLVICQVPKTLKSNWKIINSGKNLGKNQELFNLHYIQYFSVGLFRVSENPIFGYTRLVTSPYSDSLLLLQCI